MTHAAAVEPEPHLPEPIHQKAVGEETLAP